MHPFIAKFLHFKLTFQELLEDTVAFREKALIIIGNFLKYIESFVKQGGPPDSLRYISYKAVLMEWQFLKHSVLF